MRIAIAGASGFVGSALVRYCASNNIGVVKLARNRSGALPDSPGFRTIRWDPDSGYIDIKSLEASDVDAIVNLSGENVHQRWTAASKELIIDSRVKSTALLARTIGSLSNKPRVFVSASGISYYLDYNGQKDGQSHPFLDESAPQGAGFLCEVCRKWEDAAKVNGDTRVVNLRIGIAIGPHGGVLAKLLPLFRAGLGPKWGSGGQFMSWIAVDDLVRIIHFVISNDSVSGPVNAVSPNAVDSGEFSETLGRVLRRPVWIRIPASVARLVFGSEWADSTLLADYRIAPRVLLDKGFMFEYPELEPALRHMLNNSKVS